MKRKKADSDPQLSLGLSFKDLRILEYLRYRVSKIVVILDEISFWRLPILYLVFFFDATLGYWLYFSVLNTHQLPPTIPILYYSPQVDTLTATKDLFILFFFLVALHILSIYVSSKLFYKLRQLSILLLMGCNLSTFLFWITIFKSASLALP